MSGRVKRPGEEPRNHRTTIRWTETEINRIERAKEKLGLPYDVDVIRMFTLKGVEELLP
jgi:hypothetical protein